MAETEKALKCGKFSHVFFPFAMLQCKVGHLQVKRQFLKLTWENICLPCLAPI